jgi:hypothetical protein
MPARVPGVRRWRDGWQARWYFGGKEQTRLFDDYDEAVEFRLKQMVARRRGTGRDPSGVRIRFGDWWAHCASPTAVHSLAIICDGQSLHCIFPPRLVFRLAVVTLASVSPKLLLSHLPVGELRA